MAPACEISVISVEGEAGERLCERLSSLMIYFDGYTKVI